MNHFVRQLRAIFKGVGNHGFIICEVVRRCPFSIQSVSESLKGCLVRKNYGYYNLRYLKIHFMTDKTTFTWNFTNSTKYRAHLDLEFISGCYGKLGKYFI